MSHDLMEIDGLDGEVCGTQTLADYVLLRMYGIYPSMVERILKDDGAIRLWIHEMDTALTHSGIDQAGVDVALDYARVNLDWPPLSVPMFIRLCFPVRDYEAAFKEAQSNAYRIQIGEAVTWSHPAVYWAADRFGWYEVRNCSWEQCKNRWSDVMIEVLRWPNHPDPRPSPRLTSRGGLQTKEVQQAAIEEIRKRLGM